MKTHKKWLVIGIFFVVVGALFFITVPLNAGAYITHAKISIVGNNQFTLANGVIGGTGTQTDPFIIEGWDIDADGTGSAISIENTDAYFVVRNCKLYGSGTGTYDSGIELREVENGILENNHCSNNKFGISLVSSSNNLILENDCVSNMDGIFIYYNSNNNLVSNNFCCENSIRGIRIQLNCEYNIIYNYNNCSNNAYGITLQGVNNIIVSNATLTSNGVGIDFYQTTHSELKYSQVTDSTYVGLRVYSNSNYNSIHYNNFINNPTHASQISESENNAWNLSYPSGGNYWDDYMGVDNYNGEDQEIPGSDGIGDSPYEITTGVYDYYPLMCPWSAEIDPAVAINDLIDDVTGLELSGGIENSLVSKLENALASWEKENINAAENKLYAFINQVEALSGNKLTEAQADALIATANEIIESLE